jgi:hypothetical protein
MHYKGSMTMKRFAQIVLLAASVAHLVTDGRTTFRLLRSLR